MGGSGTEGMQVPCRKDLGQAIRVGEWEGAQKGSGEGGSTPPRVKTYEQHKVIVGRAFKQGSHMIRYAVKSKNKRQL